jgi:hypothetical protein
MRERTTVRLSDDLIRRAKRVLPPVSTATGGLMPGADLNETAALHETEDLKYAERLK